MTAQNYSKNNPVDKTIGIKSPCSWSTCDYPNIQHVQMTQEYWEAQDPQHLWWTLFVLEIIRRFESMLLSLQNFINGPIHSSIGEEAVAVGTALALNRNDKVLATHRAHHDFLAKLLSYHVPPGTDLFSDLSRKKLETCIRKTLAEIMGLEPGWIRGRGGSMHLFDSESGNIGTQAIVGAGVPTAAGAAFAEKFRGTDNVVLCYLGDGAVATGAFHEGLVVAKAYSVPAIYVIENNLYAVGTSSVEVSGLEDLALRACAYGIPGLIVDGMDPLAVKRAVESAKSHACSGNGPVIIEAKTYRFLHQN